MSKFLKIAWRNIWRNRRRSLITMGAIVFAILITGVTRSLQYGTYDALESYAVRLLVGELQLQNKGFHEHQTLTYSFPENLFPWDRLVDEYDFVEAYAKRITSYGLVGSASTSAGAMIIGIEPGRERRVTHFTTQLTAGETLDDADDHRILLGKSLAENLNVAPGDTVVVLTQGYRNELGADSYIVKGLIRSGNQELDRALMVMSLRDAQDLFSLYGRITQVVLATDDFRLAEKYARRMHIAMDGQELQVLPWQKLMPELLQLIALDNISGAIFLLFLLLIVGFEIMNTTLMAIMERIKEFGILQSLGVKPRQVSLMLLLETGMKIVIAVIVGLLLTFIFIQLTKDYPIPLSSELKEAMEAWGFFTDFYFTDKARVFLEPLVAISVIAVLSIIYPIWMASRLRPVDALRKGQL
ncbi:MAG: FtsX-like permease family protein [candidate division KSB1 bacterium]|nr:FtsX-like permease family protein [candidate division KSB1 bacterium]